MIMIWYNNPRAYVVDKNGYPASDFIQNNGIRGTPEDHKKYPTSFYLDKIDGAGYIEKYNFSFMPVPGAYKFDIENSKSCLAMFKFNNFSGILNFIFIFLINIL